MGSETNLLCRACLCTSTLLTPIVSFDPNIQQNYREMFDKCTNLKVTEHDGLPDKLCIDCIDELTACYSFRNKCIQSDKELRYLEENISAETDIDINYISSDQIYNVASDDSKDNLHNNTILAVFPCRKCFKYFITYDDLLEHNSEHPVQDCMNSCCYCGKKHQSMRHLTQHINKNHFNDHQIECGYCNFECTTEFHMANHMSIAHQNTTGLDLLIDILNEAVQKTVAEQLLTDNPQLKPVKLKSLQINDSQVNITNTCDEYSFETDSMIEENLIDQSDSLITYETEHVFDSSLIEKETENFNENNIVKTDEIIEDESNSISMDIIESDANRDIDLEDEGSMDLKDDPTYDEMKEDLFSDDTDNSRNNGQENQIKKKKGKKCKLLHECSVCNEKFSTLLKLQRHVITHNPDKPYRCTFVKCKCAFTNEESLETHVLVYHNNSDGKNQCTYCEKSYAKPKHLRAHMVTHRMVKRFKCKYCPKSFHLSHHWKNHEKIHINNKPYLCADCGKSFLTKDRLALHQRIHLNIKKYCCDICDKRFITNFQLTLHKVSHSNERPYLCSHCGKSFKLDTFLKNHIRNRHDNNVPKIKKNVLSTNSIGAPTKKLIKKEVETYCLLCSTNFETSAELSQHMKIHIYQYSCDICSKPFALKCKLEQHIKIHEKNKTNYSCSVCGAIYNRPDHLRYHVLRKHTEEKPFKCELCHRGFIQSGDLKVHMRRHAGERPFSCDVCSKTFITTTGLNSHKRLHTGERPYVCSICNKAYSSSSGLSIHTRTHNKPFPNNNIKIIDNDNNTINF